LVNASDLTLRRSHFALQRTPTTAVTVFIHLEWAPVSDSRHGNHRDIDRLRYLVESFSEVFLKQITYIKES
jgi:hypothetical protein